MRLHLALIAGTMMSLLCVMPASAQNLATCEIVVDEYGTTEEVPCCDITPEYRVIRGGLPLTDEDIVDIDDACQDAQAAIELRASTSTLRRVYRRQTLDILAKLLRRTPGTDVGAFKIELPVLTYTQYCCDCVIGENCSANTPSDVCTYTSDGSCPADTIRTICTYDGEWGCSGVD